MGLFFLLAGLVSGLWIGRGGSLVFLSLLSIVSLFLLFASIKHGRWRGFAIGFSSGLALSLLYSLVLVGVGGSKVVGMVVKSSDSYFIIDRLGFRYYVKEYGHPYQEGDLVRVVGEISPLQVASYESRFDFLAYLHSLGARMEGSGESELLFGFPLRLKRYEDAFLSRFDEDARSALSALLFNRRDYDSALVGRASSLNLVYLLSSSGFLYGGFLRLTNRAFSRFGEKAGRVAELSVSCLLLPFCLSKPGALRVFAATWLRGRISGRLERSSTSLLCLLALDFRFAYQSGFLLGGTISIFMTLSQSVLGGLRKGKRKLAGLAVIQLLCLPAAISFSCGEWHLLSPVYALLLSPLLSLIYPLGQISFFIVPIGMPLDFLSKALSGALWTFSRFDPCLYLPAPGEELILGYYMLIFALFLLFEIGERRRVGYSSLLAISSYAISLCPALNLLSAEVSFINVGQGDSILVRDGAHAALIDTGGSLSFDMAEEVILPYLRKRRVYSLDYLILTHSDFDHAGAKDSLLDNIEVGEVVDDASSFPIYLGDTRIDNLNDYGIAGENESSLVLSFHLGDDDYLLMGDAPVEVEHLILNDFPGLQADILKVGHHGSDTSTSPELLLSLTPEVAVISVGHGNRYGHPDQQVIARLEAIGADIRRTDLEGTITFSYPFA